MGVYMLQDGIPHKMDTARSNFFWHGPSFKKKYHMAKWDLLISLEKAGGLGFTNTKIMNRCPLAKWIFRLERGDSNICFGSA